MLNEIILLIPCLCARLTMILNRSLCMTVRFRASTTAIVLPSCEFHGDRNKLSCKRRTCILQRVMQSTIGNSGSINNATQSLIKFYDRNFVHFL